MDEEKIKSVFGAAFLKEYKSTIDEERLKRERILDDDEKKEVIEQIKTMDATTCQTKYKEFDVVLVEAPQTIVRKTLSSGAVTINMLWRGMMIGALFNNVELSNDVVELAPMILVGKVSEREYEGRTFYNMRVNDIVLL